MVWLLLQRNSNWPGINDPHQVTREHEHPDSIVWVRDYGGPVAVRDGSVLMSKKPTG